MTTSQSPKKVTSAKAWKKASQGIQLELPSGNVVKARRPGVQNLLATGYLPDSLMPIINESIQKGKALPPSKIQETIDSNSSVLLEIMDATDRIAAKCVIEPVVRYHRVEVDGEWEDIPDEDRDDEIVYTDDIDDGDKSFIFQWAMGGSADLERFRVESEEYMASVQSVTDDGDSSV
jgi:hypothetical protein